MADADQGHTNLVLGVGIGVFVLGFLWTLSVVVCIVFSRASGGMKYASFGLMALTAVLTGILLAMPRESSISDDDVNVIYDYSIIYRSFLIAILAVSIIVSLMLMLVKHAMQPVFAKPLRKTH